MKTLILGCGITGLIASHLIKDSLVFEASDKPCKDFTNETFPKYLEVCPQIDELFKSVNLRPEIAPFNIDILHDNGIFYRFHDQLAPKQEIYDAYCLKKYGGPRVGKMNSYLETTGKTCYYTNRDALLALLYEANKHKILLSSSAKRCDLLQRSIELDNGQIYEYKSLISTLPVTLFGYLSGETIERDNLCIKTIETTLSTKAPLADFIYVNDPKYSFHRVTKSLDSKRLSFEFVDGVSNIHDDELQFINRYMVTEITDSVIKEFVFPICDKKPYVGDNVHFIGRFATGNYNTKVEDTINEIRWIEKTL